MTVYTFWPTKTNPVQFSPTLKLSHSPNRLVTSLCFNKLTAVKLKSHVTTIKLNIKKNVRTRNLYIDLGKEFRNKFQVVTIVHFETLSG